MILAAIASRTRWYARALCRFFKTAWGAMQLFMTDSLSPNKNDFPTSRTPRYRSVVLMAMIWSVAVLPATNSDPYVAVSVVACFFENQSTGVWLTKWRTPVTALPVIRSWKRFASTYVVWMTSFPFGSGASLGSSSFAPP